MDFEELKQECLACRRCGLLAVRGLVSVTERHCNTLCRAWSGSGTRFPALGEGRKGRDCHLYVAGPLPAGERCALLPCGRRADAGVGVPARGCGFYCRGCRAAGMGTVRQGTRRRFAGFRPCDAQPPLPGSFACCARHRTTVFRRKGMIRTSLSYHAKRCFSIYDRFFEKNRKMVLTFWESVAIINNVAGRYGRQNAGFGPVVQLVRTLACHARGRQFEPDSGRHLLL